MRITKISTTNKQKLKVLDNKEKIELIVDTPLNSSKVQVANQTDDMFNSKYQSSFENYDSWGFINQSLKNNWISRKSSKQIGKSWLKNYDAEFNNENFDDKFYQTCNIIVADKCHINNNVIPAIKEPLKLNKSNSESDLNRKIIDQKAGNQPITVLKSHYINE